MEDWLPLPVPIEAAVNKEEVAAYEAKKAEAEAKGERLSGEEKVSCGFTICVLVFEIHSFAYFSQ